MESLCRYVKYLLVILIYTGISEAQTDFLLDTNTIYTAAALGQKYPAVTFGGSRYFSFWIDSRGGITDDSLHLYGCRVTPQGIVM